MTESSDGYGQLLLAALDGQPVVEIVEREDGFINASQFGPGIYFAPFRRWPPHHRRAMRFVRGRVLDIGCGAGRVCLHLQERGHEVVGVDLSPGAVEVCRRRGVRDVRLVGVDDVDESLGRFDTIVMLGNNFGVVGSRENAVRLLRRFRALTSDRGRIVAESRDVGRTEDPVHVGYQEQNRERGRMPGQIRIRVRFREHATPWFDYLMVSPAELEELVEDTGWRIGRVLESDDTYVAVLEKVSGSRAPG
jgi:cyclopropane fatty-acyl-phospholipid synthase-like methyltransferase